MSYPAGTLHIVSLLFLLSLTAGCSLSGDRSPAGSLKEDPALSGRNTEDGIPAHARGFSVEEFTDFTIINVRDPWQGSAGVRFRYVLSDETGRIPDSLAHLPGIQVPVSRVVCMSTTHIAMVEALGRSPSIIGVSGTSYISNEYIRGRISRGEVHDVGADQSLDYERIISLDPDVVFAYGVTAEINGMVKRLGNVGIPVVLNADYLEVEPLGKTEWIRFLASFYGLSDRADSLFRTIETEYIKYREIAGSVPRQPPAGHSPGPAAGSSASSGESSASSLSAAPASGIPRVMTGLPWKDSWYVPGANSFAAAFIRDAGGEYIWQDMESREAAPVDLESVYARGTTADIWINCGSAASLEDIRQTESRLSGMKPFRDGKVFNNTARLNSTGGNDFWEKGVMEPHLVLADLVSIFHPPALPGHELRYYRQLK